MNRTRAALIEGARRSIEKVGVRQTSMADIADQGQIARATLYNHFRSKQDVFLALVEDEIEQMRAIALEQPTLDGALLALATYLRDHRVLAPIVAREPAIVAMLTRITPHETWLNARSALADVYARHRTSEPNPAAVDIALRWLVTQISSPSEDLRRSIAVIAAL